MSEVLSKRELIEPHNSASKRQEVKKISKPGRKPLDTEPKNKRTAQNRAAQRAFRERKEQKMKELENKIIALEDEKNSVSTEAEFLKAQVQMLMAELAKHRGTKTLNDLILPNLNQQKQQDNTPDNNVSNVFSPNGSEVTSRSSNSEKTPGLSFEFPWSHKNSVNSKQSPISSNYSSTNLPVLSSDSSTASSNESSPFELYNIEAQQDLPLFKETNKGPKSPDIKRSDNDFKFNENFDEGVSDFCNELSLACGTKECPIPKSKSQVSSTLLETTKNTPTLSYKQDDPLSFLDENNFATFDPSLAFAQDIILNDLFDDQNLEKADPLAQLTTEESMYDPFGLFSDVRKSPKEASHDQAKDSSPTQLQTPTSLQQDSEVVPAKETRYLKCTEIWDRITTHPRYSDIDIDGLCNELRAKAKCSDKGVVIDYVDVDNVIKNTLTDKSN